MPDFSLYDLQNVYGEDDTDGQGDIGTYEQAEEALRRALCRQMDIVEKFVKPGVALIVGAMEGGLGNQARL